jgi:hypothetical protein
MTAKVIPFPRPELSREEAAVVIVSGGDHRSRSGLMTRCEGAVHVFAKPEGRCQCGSDEWGIAVDEDLFGAEEWLTWLDERRPR